MSRSRSVRRLFKCSQWRFAREKAAHFTGGKVLSPEILLEFCQEFFWRFHWYVFPSEMKRRISSVQARQTRRKRCDSRSKDREPAIRIYFACRRPLRRPRAILLS